MVLQVNLTNIVMIMEILQNNYSMVEELTHTKYVNPTFDIIVKNNTSIIVIDKRGPTMYKDLKTAHNIIVKL